MFKCEGGNMFSSICTIGIYAKILLREWKGAHQIYKQMKLYWSLFEAESADI